MTETQKTSRPQPLAVLPNHEIKRVLAETPEPEGDLAAFVQVYCAAIRELVVNIVRRNHQEELILAIAHESAAVLSTINDTTRIYLVDLDILPALIARKVGLGHGIGTQTTTRIKSEQLKALMNGTSNRAETYFDGLFAADAWTFCSISKYHPEETQKKDTQPPFEFFGSQDYGWWIIEPKRFWMSAESVITPEIWAIIIGLCAYK